MEDQQQIPQKVRKMLVVGLGTTGTDICTYFADRLIQEYGSLEATPWIRFLCVETNKAKECFLKDRGDLMPITLNAQEFSMALQGPQSLNEAIDLSGWADFSVLHGDGDGQDRLGLLNNIGDIESGAGNIRMAGRLAWLYPRNFGRFKQEFESRFNDLIKLSEHDAAVARGPMPGGADPPIAFAGSAGINQGAPGANDIIVVVVGSLCGGTASGICVDVGYFIHHVAPGAKRLAIFSLPRPDLVPSGNLYANAERYKKNAHSALKELHHFSQVARSSYTVKYAVHNEPLRIQQAYPYDLITLAWPDNGFPEAEQRLRATIAERLFINTFNTATDPFVKGIDGMAGREYRIHDEARHTLFCTFGLSVLEFPAPRLVEYGATRLLETVLKPWQEHTADQDIAAREASEAGVSWDGLKRTLLAQDAGVLQRVAAKVESAVDSALRDPGTFSGHINQLRLAFGENVGSEPDTNLPWNAVPDALRAARNACVEQTWQTISNRLRECMGNWQKGPRYAGNVVKAALDVIHRLQEELPRIAGSEPPAADATVQVLNRLRHDGYVNFIPGLYRKAAADASAGLKNDLSAFVTNRLERAVANILADTHDVNGIPQPGVLGLLEERLQKVQRRLANLQTAAQAYAGALTTQKLALAAPPPVNGVCLMDDKTADRAYVECLAPDGDPARLSSAEQRQTPAILQAFASAAASVTAIEQASPWDAPAAANAGLRALPQSSREALMGAARVPFQALLSRSVVGEWSAQTDRDGFVTKFLNAAAIAMGVDDNKAAQLRQNSPVTSVNVLVYPQDGPMSSAFAQMADTNMAFSPEPAVEPTRAIALHERYCIPPEALTGVVAVEGTPNALENARFSTFSTFSRKDVVWGPMSEREEEHLRACERLLAVAIAAGDVGVRGGWLHIKYPPKDFGDVDYRRFAPNFPSAVLKWALVGRDDENRDLASLKETLSNAIQARIQTMGGREFAQMLRRAAFQTPPGLTGWSPTHIGKVLTEFCAADGVLRDHLENLNHPNDDILRVLFYRQGEMTVMRRPAPEEGFRCINVAANCDTLLGATDEEATRHGWKCEVCGACYAAWDEVDKTAWVNAAVSAKAAPA